MFIVRWLHAQLRLSRVWVRAALTLSLSADHGADWCDNDELAYNNVRLDVFGRGLDVCCSLLVHLCVYV